MKYLSVTLACMFFSGLAYPCLADRTFANDDEISKVYLTEALYEDLEEGKVLVFEKALKKDGGRKETWMEALVLVDAPPCESWQVLNDLGHYYKFQPRLRESKIVKKQGSSTVVRLSFKAAWKKVFYHLRYTRDDKTMTLHYALDRSFPYNIGDARGWWQVIPHRQGNKTIIDYVSYVDTGMWVPRFIEKIFIKKDLPRVVSYVKKRIESGGTWNQWE